ncbi:MAG: hypothetical protein V4577_10185 [Bacteroidota bacterium]
MDYSQLELFQIPNEYENDIFEKAKQLKTIAQEAYDRIEFQNSNLSLLKNYAVLKVTVDIDQIRENEPMVEPNMPKMFIWHFTPSISIEIDGVPQSILNKGDKLNNIMPKIIPKWINNFFTRISFSYNDFKKYTGQYYTLELLNLILLNEEIFEKVENIIGDRELIIYFDSKLFINKNLESSSLLPSDLINRIRNFYFKLKTNQKSNWYFIANYEDFTSENDLLTELDENEYISAKKDEVLGKSVISETFTWTYQNDYLFLNNSENHYDKHNTSNWNKNYIVSPRFLNKEFLNFETNILSNKVKGQKENRNREFYCYSKKGTEERFIRNDILLPDINLSNEKLQEIVVISQMLKNGWKG